MTAATTHAEHDLWPLLSRPGVVWCRDCQIHFAEGDPDDGVRVSAHRVDRFEGEVWRYSVTSGPTLHAPLVSDVQAIEHLERYGRNAPAARRLLEAARLVCESELGEVFPR